MASSEKRLSKEEIRKITQQACKEIACASAARGMILCPFCPHSNKQATQK